RYTQFSDSVSALIGSNVTFLQNGSEINVYLQPLTPHVRNILPGIDIEIGLNEQLLQDRHTLVSELNELTAKEFLFHNKATILGYYDEYKFKAWIDHCRSQLSTTGISRKIGELMETQAVNLQHQEFVAHLNFFNQDLSTKVLISKTRTSQGSTFQKCSLNGIDDSIDSVLSEGEQKIIALSNFLAECTID